MAQEDYQFDDPDLARDENTVVWAIRRAFGVAFYEDDERVTLVDACISLLVGFVIVTAPAVMVTIIGFVVIGPTKTSTAVSAGVSSGVEPATLAFNAVALIMALGLLIIYTGVIKFVRSDLL